jgi:hypothetical protein
MKKYIIESLLFVFVILLFYSTIINNGKIEENTVYVFLKANIYSEISVIYFLVISFLLTISLTSFLIFSFCRELKKSRINMFYKLNYFFLIILLAIEFFYLMIYSYLFKMSTFVW